MTDADRGRPIADAAAEAQALAAEARAALAELKAGWLWQLLTRKTLRTLDVSKHQTTPTDAT